MGFAKHFVAAAAALAAYSSPLPPISSAPTARVQLDKLHLYFEPGVNAATVDSAVQGVLNAQAQNPYFHPRIESIDTLSVPSELYDSIPDSFLMRVRTAQDERAIVFKTGRFYMREANNRPQLQRCLSLWQHIDECEPYNQQEIDGMHVGRTIYLVLPKNSGVPLPQFITPVLNHELVHDYERGHEKAPFLFNEYVQVSDPKLQLGLTPYALGRMANGTHELRAASLPVANEVEEDADECDLRLERDDAALAFVTAGNLAYFHKNNVLALEYFALAKREAADSALRAQATLSHQYMLALMSQTHKSSAGITKGTLPTGQPR
jgi:hypothetical protein